MMNFDEARFLRIQTGAVAQAEAIDTAVAECLSRGADNLFFLGTGGAGILMQPATLLLRTQSLFPVFCELPAEIVLTGREQLDTAFDRGGPFTLGMRRRARSAGLRAGPWATILLLGGV